MAEQIAHEWKRIFAWWPVELSVMNEYGFFVRTGEYAWLSHVERLPLFPHDGSDFAYRIPEKSP